jgi:hypothetical protein
MREWYLILTAPLDRNLQLSVQEKEEVHSLVFPCRRIQKGWVNALTGNQLSSILRIGVTDWTKVRAKITSKTYLSMPFRVSSFAS